MVMMILHYKFNHNEGRALLTFTSDSDSGNHPPLAQPTAVATGSNIIIIYSIFGFIVINSSVSQQVTMIFSGQPKAIIKHHQQQQLINDESHYSPHVLLWPHHLHSKYCHCWCWQDGHHTAADDAGTSLPANSNQQQRHRHQHHRLLLIKILAKQNNFINFTQSIG